MPQSDERIPAREKRPPGGFTRRHFLELIGAGAIGVAAVGSGVLTTEYLSPNVVKEPPTKFKAGMPESYPPVFIVRAREGYFYALSATCTHLGCIANWKADEGIVACPCHGSKFDREGNVIAGPAPRPLPRYAMSLDDHGQIVIDKSLVVGDEATLKV